MGLLMVLIATCLYYASVHLTRKFNLLKSIYINNYIFIYIYFNIFINTVIYIFINKKGCE